MRSSDSDPLFASESLSILAASSAPSAVGASTRSFPLPLPCGLRFLFLYTKLMYVGAMIKVVVPQLRVSSSLFQNPAGS